MKVLKIFLLLLAVTGLFLSCTKIEEPFATVRNANIKDTTMNWDTIAAARKVLVEDYTGHKCTNCPDAAVTASSLEETYEDAVIVMAVHAGYYAKPDNSGDYTLDLTTTTGQEWNSEFKFSAYPNGMVDRMPFEGNRIIPYGKWNDAIETILGTDPVFQMKISNVYNSQSRKLTTSIYSRSLVQLAGEYTLTVCIVEDSIIGAQKNDNPNTGPTPDWFGYVFNGVLRGSMNGTYGELMATLPDPAVTYVARYTVTLDDDYVPKNCRVLAFISNKSTKEILQTEIRKVIP